MFKDMSKLEKAGLIIGGIECVVGFGIAMYTHHKIKKQSNVTDNQEVIDQMNDILHQAMENKED